MPDNDDAQYDPHAEVSYQRHPIDLFLLAIIDGQRDMERDDEWQRLRVKRLEGALLALFGEKPRRGAKPIDDRRALSAMAREHRRDLWLQQQIKHFGMVPPEGFDGLRSDPELARQVSNTRRGASLAADIERRSDAFRKSKSALLARLDLDDDANAQLGKNTLDSALRAVAKLGIKVKLEP